LCVYREVQVLKKAVKSNKPGKPVAIVSYDEKPGIQAIATTAPDLPPEPGVHPTFARALADQSRETKSSVHRGSGPRSWSSPNGSLCSPQGLWCDKRQVR